MTLLKGDLKKHESICRYYKGNRKVCRNAKFHTFFISSFILLKKKYADVISSLTINTVFTSPTYNQTKI